jgi:hypothetical protein
LALKQQKFQYKKPSITFSNQEIHHPLFNSHENQAASSIKKSIMAITGD